MYFKFINDIFLLYRFKKKYLLTLFFFYRNRLKSIQPDEYIACTLHGVLIVAFYPKEKYTWTLYINYHNKSPD